jgi:HAMP domain-containing protein
MMRFKWRHTVDKQDENITGQGQETKDQGDQQPVQTRPITKTMNVEDLKARLGLKITPKKEETAKPEEKQIGDTGLSMDSIQGTTISEAEIAEMEKDATKPKSGLTKNIIITAIVVFVVFVIGLFFGRVLRERRLENIKRTEAEVIAANLATARNDVARSELQKLISAHSRAVREFYGKLQDMRKNPQTASKMMDELRAFMDVCAVYRDNRVFFTVPMIFPKYVINGELISDVLDYMNTVKILYEKTEAIAAFRDMLVEVTGTEEKGEMKQYILVEPFEKEGLKFLRSTYYIADISLKDIQETKTGALVPVLPVGSSSGELVDTASIVELDIAPVAASKSIRYKTAIMKRVESLIEELKKAADNVVLMEIEQRINKEVDKPTYWLAF